MGTICPKMIRNVFANTTLIRRAFEICSEIYHFACDVGANLSIKPGDIVSNRDAIFFNCVCDATWMVRGHLIVRGQFLVLRSTPGRFDELRVMNLRDGSTGSIERANLDIVARAKL